ncbi:MAG: Rho termination factor N-terminal domain-containing protein [Saprospiraceae bacterium]|nr:Rho termination factor N-terminal domain-containing protein [Saprospiraceae bacterium]
MYSISQSNEMLLNELKDVAEAMNIRGFRRMNKQELVYRILDEQAVAKKQQEDPSPERIETSLYKADKKFNGQDDPAEKAAQKPAPKSREPEAKPATIREPEKLHLK